MTEPINEKDQKWKELKLKWSVSPSLTPKIQEPQNLKLKEKETESKSLSDIVNSLEKKIEEKQITLKDPISQTMGVNDISRPFNLIRTL